MGERAPEGELDQRKTAILRKVVEEHIETGQPVGSAHIVRDGTIDVSPATVRSDMAVLEREGYLTHPHTSAGRVPTDKGYRFFVDSLEHFKPLDPTKSDQVASFFSRAHGELEGLLRDTSRLLSGLTDHAAVVTAPKHEVLIVKSALITRLSPSLGLFVVVLSNGAVEKHAIELDESLPDAAIDLANAKVREHLSGLTLGEVSPVPSTGDQAVDDVLARCHAVLAAAPARNEEADVFVGGTARMAEQFAAVDTVREVLSILEQSFVVVSLLAEVLSAGHNVSIGSENKVTSLSECSLVVAPYEVGEHVLGTIGVLGPTRMNYPEALAAVAVVSKRLGDELSR